MLGLSDGDPTRLPPIQKESPGMNIRRIAALAALIPLMACAT